MKADELLKEYKAGRRDFKGVDLSNQNLSNCILVEVNLSDANLTGANLSKVIFDKVSLHGAILSFTILNPADLSGCDLCGANLSGAKLDPKRTKLLNTLYDQDTQFPEGFSPIGASYVGVVSEDIPSLVSKPDESSIKEIEKLEDKLVENSLPALPQLNTQSAQKDDKFTDRIPSPPIDKLNDTKTAQQFSTPTNLESTQLSVSDIQIQQKSLITPTNLFFMGAGIGLVLLIPILIFLQSNQISKVTQTTTSINKPNSSASKVLTETESSLQTTKVSTATFQFPMDSCGDQNPGGTNTWYPVYVDYSEENISIVKTRYCRDALPLYKKEIAKQKIQVASFINNSKADELARLLKIELGSGEVGNPVLYPTKELVKKNLNDEIAKSVVKSVYLDLSNKQWTSASSFYSSKISHQFDPNFFKQFNRVDIDDIQVTSRSETTINLVGVNSYFYPEGTTQVEERSYKVELINGEPLITDSQFVKVIRLRNCLIKHCRGED